MGDAWISHPRRGPLAASAESLGFRASSIKLFGPRELRLKFSAWVFVSDCLSGVWGGSTVRLAKLLSVVVASRNKLKML